MANLKSGTLIGGNLIWNAGNLPLHIENDNIFFKNSVIYTESNKPTAADVNAVSKTGDTMTGKLNANGGVEISSATPMITFTETDSGNKKYILVSDANGIRLNKNTTSVQNETLVWRWVEGADLSSSRLELINPISRTAQLTDSNALTRYDYVTGELAKKVSKSGDTITGRIVFNYNTSIKVPVGTTAQRGTGVSGDFRFNTDEVTFEGYDGSEWQTIGSGKVKYTMYTESFTAVKGRGHLVDTRVRGIIVTLPTDAKDSDFVVIGDGAKNAHVNPFFVAGFNGDRVKVDRENCVLVFSKVGTKWVIVDGIGETGALRIGDFLPAANGTVTGRLSINTSADSLTYIGKNDGDASKGVDYRNDDDTLAGTFGMRWNGIQKTIDSFYVGTTTSATWFKVKSNGELYANGNSRIYHQGYKPTAVDVGALPLTGNSTVTGYIDVTQPVSVKQSGFAVRMTASSERGYIQGGSIDTATNQKMWLTGYVGRDLTELTLQLKDGTTPNVRWGATNHKIYHQGFKPTPTDVGMTGKAIGTPQSLGAEDLDTLKTAGVYAQHANNNTSTERHYPENLAGSLIVTVGAGVQQRYHVYNTSRVWTRAQYSTGGWTAWAREYNTLNKPTKSDVGLSNVNNWEATSNVADGSATKYATAAAIAELNDLAFVYGLIM